MPEPKNIHDRARLAKAERLAPDGVMSAKMEGGRMTVGPSVRPAGLEPAGENVAVIDECNASHVEAQGLGLTPKQLEAKAQELGYDENMTMTELEERTRALTALINAKMKWERDQIVKSIKDYAHDCDERCKDLVLEGKRAYKHLRRSDDPKAADTALESANHRASAFKVRAAISLDIAKKVASGWGRE